MRRRVTMCGRSGRRWSGDGDCASSVPGVDAGLEPASSAIVGVMIQPPFFIFHPLLKLLPLRHLHQLLSQHMHNKHQFDTSPLPTSLCHPHHRLWIYARPVHLVPPSLTSCPSQPSLTSRTHTCRPRLVPPKPSTFGKPSTVPRSTPLRPETEPHCRDSLLFSSGQRRGT